MKVKVVIHEYEDGYAAEIPAIPGCVTQGDTREELLANIREVIEGSLLVIPGNFESVESGGKVEEVEV